MIFRGHFHCQKKDLDIRFVYQIQIQISHILFIAVCLVGEIRNNKKCIARSGGSLKYYSRGGMNAQCGAIVAL